ncbi:hypothetical protein EMCRGX_G003612 [Ephydatia muelleri]
MVKRVVTTLTTLKVEIMMPQMVERRRSCLRSMHDVEDVGPLDPNMPPVPEKQPPTPPMLRCYHLSLGLGRTLITDLYWVLYLHLSSDGLPDLTYPQNDLACEGRSVVIAVIESAQLGSSGAARTCTLATVSVTVTTISNFSLNDEQHQHSEA